jgi:hypothetical protein
VHAVGELLVPCRPEAVVRQESSKKSSSRRGGADPKTEVGDASLCHYRRCRGVEVGNHPDTFLVSGCRVPEEGGWFCWWCGRRRRDTTWEGPRPGWTRTAVYDDIAIRVCSLEQLLLVVA